MFLNFVNSSKVVEDYLKNQITKEQINDIIEEQIPHYIKYMLPNISRTGTDVDDTDINMKESIKKDDILDVNQLIGYELLPILLQGFCLSNDKKVEKKLLELILKMYNQRENYVFNAQHLQILFDKDNIEIYKKSIEALPYLENICNESEV